MKKVSLAAVGMAAIAPAAFTATGIPAVPVAAAAAHRAPANTHADSKSVRLTPGQTPALNTPDVSLGSHCTANVGVEGTSSLGYQEYWYKNWPGTNEVYTCIGTVERYFHYPYDSASRLRIRIWHGNTLEYSDPHLPVSANWYTTNLYGIHRWLYGQPLGVCTALYNPLDLAWLHVICADT
jgi:hypothetical protein